MRSRVLRILVSIGAVALPLAALAPPAAAATPAAQFVTMVNNLRSQNRVAPLATDPAMTSVAEAWANNMANTQSLSHNPNEATQIPSGWTKMGENIGEGHSLAAVYASLVASQPHYANMVDPAFNHTGVGVAIDSNGQVWVAEDLADYPPPQTPVIVFPTTGTVIFPSSQTFSWQAVPGATIYCLTVGTTMGALDLFNSGNLLNGQLSVMVPTLPVNNSLWIRVYSFVAGTWSWSDANFAVT